MPNRRKRIYQWKAHRLMKWYFFWSNVASKFGWYKAQCRWSTKSAEWYYKQWEYVPKRSR